MSAERGVSMAALIREAIDRLPDAGAADEKWSRALAVMGKFRDRGGARNVAQEHDRYLEEAYGR